MITKTYKQLSDLDTTIFLLYQEKPELKNTKFGWGYKRFYEKNLKKIFDDYNAILIDIRIDNALIDERTKAIKTTKENDRGFLYSPDGFKNVIKAEKKLWEDWKDKEFEVEPYIIAADSLPELIEEQIELMKDILIA